MKKLVIALLLSCMSLLLATTAAAEDGVYMDAWFDIYTRYNNSVDTYEFCFDGENNYGSFSVSSSRSEVTLTCTFGFPTGYTNNVYVASIFFTVHNMSNTSLIFPSSVILNKGQTSSVEIPIGDRALHQLDFHGFDIGSVQSYCSVSQDPHGNYTKVCGIDIIISGAYGVQSMDFVYDPAPFETTSSSIFHCVSPAYIAVQGASFEGIYEELVTLISTTQSQTNKLTSGFTSTVNALAANSDAIKQSLNAQTESMTATLDQVKEAVQTMSDNMEDEVASGMEKFFNDIKQEAVEVANDTVASIQEQFNVDISAYSNSMNTLYTAVSTHSTDANMVFPAASVTLMGEEMVFWEEQEIDFNSVFENDSVQLLLLPLRFVIYFGFAYYVFKWIGKLESLITMNKSE